MRRQRRIPEAPKGYRWRYRKGQLEVVVIEEGKPKRVYDEKTGKLPIDKGPPLRNVSTAEPTSARPSAISAATRRTTSLGMLVNVLLEQGLIKSRQEVIDQMGEPSGRTHDTVRGNVKDIFKTKLIEQLTDVKYLKKTAHYKEVLKATGDAQQATRAAGIDEMNRVTDMLANEDRGAVGERVYQELFGGKKPAPRVDISKEQLALAKGVDVADIEQARSIDRMDGTTAREIKTVSTRLGPRDRGQISRHAGDAGRNGAALDRSGQEARSGRRGLHRPARRQGQCHARTRIPLASSRKARSCSSSIRPTERSLKVTPKNMDILLKADFASKLGL